MSVTSGGNICYEIVVMQFQCNELESREMEGVGDVDRMLKGMCSIYQIVIVIALVHLCRANYNILC